jgi:hypothetical protein
VRGFSFEFSFELLLIQFLFQSHILKGGVGEFGIRGGSIRAENPAARLRIFNGVGGDWTERLFLFQESGL